MNFFMFHYQQMFDLCTYYIRPCTQGIHSCTQEPIEAPQERGCEWNQVLKLLTQKTING